MEISDSVATIFSTILGAIIASVVSWMLAKRTSKETLERDRQQRLDREKGIAVRAMVNLKSIIDHLGTLRAMLDRALSNPPSAGAPLWSCVEPIIGDEEDYRTRFAPDELAIFIEAGRADLSSDLQLLAKRNATLGAAINTMNARREDLRQKMPLPSVVGDMTATTALTREQYLTLAPDMEALDALILQIVSFLEEDFALAMRVGAEFGPVLRAHFGDEKFPALILPSEEPRRDHRPAPAAASPLAYPSPPSAST